MYDALLETPTLTDDFVSSGYGRVSVEEIEADNPVRQFHGYYRSLAECGLPRWEQFDICAVPRHVVAHIALGRPEYDTGEGSAPDHFIYTLQGGAVRSLVGVSVIGRRVGHVAGLSIAGTVQDEIDEAVSRRQIVCSRSDLDRDDRPNLRITRGLFLFSGAKWPIEKLVLVVYKMPILQPAA
ncbi:MAG: hypothetical protein P1U88_21050 [Thalassobaculaceae bacterium]|nr:hypothetical protein [Thalassobaculaceae bacterium]